MTEYVQGASLPRQIPAPLSGASARSSRRAATYPLLLAAITVLYCFAGRSAFAQDSTTASNGSVTIQESPAEPIDPAVADDADSGQQSQDAPAANPSGSVPYMLTLPEGTVIPIRMNQWLSSENNRPGDTFSGVLEQPLVADGWVIARRGQLVTGRISAAQKSAHGKDASLGLELSELTLVDGRQLPVTTQLVPYEGRPISSHSNQRDAATIGATTIVGLGVGAAVGGGTGAAIGAGVGAMIGATGVVLSHGKPAVIPPESLLTFRLQEPLEVWTERSQLAFRPVTQGDYSRPTRDQDAYAHPNPNPPARARAGYPPAPYAAPVYPPPAYYVDYPPYLGWGYYPPVYLGFYGGFGPSFGFGRGFGRGGFGRGGFRR